MIERYTFPEIGKIWEDENKYRIWLEIETLAAEAQAEAGRIPREAAGEIRRKGNFSVSRINEIEAEVHHDVIAFLTSVAEYVGESSRFVHYGMTSSDVLDTALAVQMKQAGGLISKKVEEVISTLQTQAVAHRNTIMIGRTHGVHAEPITFGFKVAVWFSEMQRNRERLAAALNSVSVGKISGAVGTFAHLEPFVEKYVCEHLGLKPAAVSTQVLQRDRHAEFLSVLAIIGASLEKIALEIRHLQRTEVLEAEEAFGSRQKGSSAMPHKKNPIISERICGMARLLRGYAMAGLENVALWHERDISHSSVERVILPDATITLYYMLEKTAVLIRNLVVHPERMLANLESTHGLIFSQSILLSLVDRGVKREEAYRIVQRNAMKVWQEKKPLLEIIKKDEEVLKYLSEKELTDICNLESRLKNVHQIFKRLNLV